MATKADVPPIAGTPLPRVSPLKRLLFGFTLATHKQEHQLLPKWMALPVFASDQLSSVAYASEQMMLILVLAGTAALGFMVPAAIGIGVLLAIVITSYRQTCRAYPRGGGSYIVARENLGTLPGLIAAAAILTSYVLTVAVSVTAGTIAITSGVEGLARYKLPIALGFVALLMIANLRGAREAGRLFALPTYGFVAIVFTTILAGFARCLDGCPRAATADLPLEPVAALSVFLLLQGFSSGATALTGVEAIADGVQAFRRPQARNAATTLALMGAMSIPMFLGITVLTRLMDVRTNHEIALHTSVLAQLGETIWGRGTGFFLLQTFTAGILVLAANTAYQDFPRLSAILARDRFMPAQFKNRGVRLVFSNGVVALSLLAGILVVLFRAELSALIHLYVVGVFTALTLSQAGMARRWARLKPEGWRRSIAVNGLGAVTTGIVLAVVAVTQFLLGAWIVIAAIPVIIGFFLGVHRHYTAVQQKLRRREAAVEAGANTFVLVVRDLDLATADAIAYLRAIRPERVLPVYVGNPTRYEEVAARWTAVAPRLGRLEALHEEGRPRRSFRSYLRAIPRGHADFVTVVVPETITGRSLLEVVFKPRAFWLKASLLFQPGIVVTDIPLLPEERTLAAEHAERPVQPDRHVVLVPVAGVHAATARAISYAKALHATHLEALFFTYQDEEVQSILKGWADWELDVPLSVVDAPFRDLRTPLLQEVRSYTSRGDTLVTVVLPEVVVRGWWQHLLHNQTGLLIKRLLLFEARVVVTSVPFRL